MKQRAIVWFRRDFRLADNPALRAAVDGDFDGIIPVFIHAPDEEGDWAPGGAQRVWQHESLAALADALEAIGSRLVIRQGPTQSTLDDLIDESGAGAAFWNRLYEPGLVRRDADIESHLADAYPELEVRHFQADLLHEPWTVETQSGKPYKVFTPFWKTISERSIRQPKARPSQLPEVWSRIGSCDLADLGLCPAKEWTAKILERWTPGEDGAQARLETFLEDTVDNYDNDRDRPAVHGTSYLSPHLHWGEISPFQVMHRAEEWLSEQSGGAIHEHIQSFQSEIGWREFSRHVLYHFPDTPDEPLDARFKAFPWETPDTTFDDWKAGMTGIPMVDAGMRELYATGYMHNRLRMTVASFLTKNLRIAWQHGERWFWDTLFDADLGNNTLGWQWAAGCGADAAPFFRIFNPARQGERFDKNGDYVRRWVPELAELSNKHLQEPWNAPDKALEAAGVVLGKTYPKPVVDLKASRREALEAFEQVKN